ncbi:DUF3801 domain-containing protein [Paenibacillus athensensis]|uniref:DUF3801 domain-containing protein n=1 Tax=Paenibacillus athensensis TaxID=1967502 RepID=A0A4Y8PZQ2_9BACL|nr:DUF3801 domain-containing protein [Paenibacillus athensensis]
MSSGAEAADQVVSMSLRGIEVMAKISGEGAKHLAVYLFAALQGQKRTKGSIRLENLLRSGKELKVFAVKNEDLPTFCKEAKRYGVLYCALRDKNHVDGLCDVMVRAEDAAKINRIVERFKLATVDTASIQSEIEKTRAEKRADEQAAEQTQQPESGSTWEQDATGKGTPSEKSVDDFLDELMGSPEAAQTEQQPEPIQLAQQPDEPTPPATQMSDNKAPMKATMELPPPSEPISERNAASARGTTTEFQQHQAPQRPSIRELLREIREENRKANKERRQLDKEPSLPKRSARQAASTKAAPAKNSRTKTNKPKSARKRGNAK